MERSADSVCDGFCRKDGLLREAPFERECGWCGVTLDLCEECREAIFICGRCYRDRSRYGPDEAKRRGKLRERRRKYMRRLRRRVHRAPQGQRMLWPREVGYEVE